MMVQLGRLLRDQRGLTLFELTVVSAILAVFAGIVALAVTGRATESREAALAGDIAEVQKAVDGYTGAQPQGRFPTLNGCLPGQVLDQVTFLCVTLGRVTDPSRINTTNLEFEVREDQLGVDLNGDGDLGDSLDVVPIVWDKAFGDGTVVKRLVPDYIRRFPRHAFDFVSGLDDSWQEGINIDPDELGNLSETGITAPEGLGTGANRIDEAIRQLPVWVIDSNGTVRNLLPRGLY